MRVVLDTNVLVSAFWSEHNRLTQIIDLLVGGILLPCYCQEIIQEYQDVLSRPRLAFHFEEASVNEIINKIKADGLCVAVKPSSIPFIDESDRIFYDVAVACDAQLVTGNIKHYPKKPFIITPFEFLSGQP